MASRPSIVFLFDLDLPSVRSGNSLVVNSDDDFPSQCTRLLRHIVLNILNYFSEKQVNIQWGYRFYSSSNYQLTNKARFVDLSTQTVEEFEEALNVRFEQNSALPDGTCLNDMSAASVLSRTLQDIISDYEWKPPSDSLTPTRKGKKPGKQLDQSLQNLVFIFTEVPSDDTISSFCKFNVQDELSIKAVTEAILPKELAKRFQEFQLSLNFIDLSHDKKTIFRKIAGNLRGAVINALSLTSPFSFSQILQASCIAEDVSLENCISCQSLLLGSKVLVLDQNDQPVEFQVQCWNNSCSKSSLCLEDTNVNISVIKCMTVQNTTVPSSSWLKHDSVYLLSSKNSLIPKLLAPKTSWIGKLDGLFCCISSLTSHTAIMIFPSQNGSSFQFWASSLFDNMNQNELSCVRSFVEKLMENERKDSPESALLPVTVQDHTTKQLLSHIKGNYVEKKGTHLGVHWQMLKNCFQSEEPQEKCLKEFNNNSFDQLTQIATSIDVASATLVASCSDGALKKIGSNRIQNLRASTLLQKSQEVRARNDEMEREKIIREKQVADEKKEKICKEFQTYLLSLRSSIGFGEEMIQLFPSTIEYENQEILEQCMKLKEQSFTSQLEDWQWLCLVQVIVSTILYVWKESMSMDLGYETICKNFMKKPATANRSTPKDSKINEFKFQIILRLELSWVVPSLVGEEEDVLQDAISLFRMLSIHSSPQIISSFFQDALIVSYENMLPEFLVNLGEELNQPIPASLTELVKMKHSTRTPSPALSSKTLSVQSIASQHDMMDSQRSSARDLRSRTLSRQPSLNILQHKKQIALPNKVERVPAPVAKKEAQSNEVVRVRRSLQFGTETPTQKNRIKSPIKDRGAVTPRRLNTSFEPMLEFTTPSKAKDLVLAPETPSRLRSDRKKSDGVNVVVESPEVKQEALRRSPRRLEAAIALRRRASFYSTLNSELNPEKGASRNWSRAESQVWSEKAKASASIQPSLEDNSPQIGQSARFLFSKILSRNDSVPSSDVIVSPRKSVIESDTLRALPSLATPRKGGLTAIFPPSTPSRQRLAVPESSGSVLAPGTPMKTPMKTPKHVQFNFSFQPATPSSKTLPDPRSILKSPMSFQSPSQNRTPRKIDAQDQILGHPHVVHVLDNTNFNGRHQLELHSPVKAEEPAKEKEEETEEEDVTGNESKLSNDSCHNNDLVHKLDENSLRADEEVEFQSPSKNIKLSKISPLVLRRSPRHSLAFQNNHGTNFYQHNPNWSVINYRRPTVDGNSQPRPELSRSVANDTNEDPYNFDDELEVKPFFRNNVAADSSSHKRKLFQSSAEKTPTTKRRRIIPNASPIEETKTPPCKFQPPKEGSLFHLENSPLLNSIEAKFLA